jgi:hypothetical protein
MSDIACQVLVHITGQAARWSSIIYTNCTQTCSSSGCSTDSSSAPSAVNRGCERSAVTVVARPAASGLSSRRLSRLVVQADELTVLRNWIINYGDGNIKYLGTAQRTAWHHIGYPSLQRQTVHETGQGTKWSYLPLSSRWCPGSSGQNPALRDWWSLHLHQLWISLQALF